MAEEDTKVYLVSVLNQETSSCLDAYVTMHGGEEMASLKTIQDRLQQVSYFQILVYLK